jgi:hypothetical protein
MPARRRRDPASFGPLVAGTISPTKRKELTMRDKEQDTTTNTPPTNTAVVLGRAELGSERAEFSAERAVLGRADFFPLVVKADNPTAKAEEVEADHEQP